MSWATFAAELTKLDVQQAHKLKDLPLNYAACLKKAKAMAKGGSRGGAIYTELRDNGASYVEEAPIPLTLRIDQAERDPAPPMLNQAPWADAGAWARLRKREGRLAGFLLVASIVDGWVWVQSRTIQQRLDTEFRGTIFQLLVDSGIQPTPPASTAPPPLAGPVGHYDRALKQKAG